MKIDFCVETEIGKYCDSLYLDKEYTSEEIENMKQIRVNNWLELVRNPPELNLNLIEIDGIKYQKIESNGQLILEPLEV